MVLKRFIDDISPEVIEVNLLGALPALLTPITAFEMPEDLVTEIAGKSEHSQSLREQLNKKMWILTKGSNTCRRFVGIRGLGKGSNPSMDSYINLPAYKFRTIKLSLRYSEIRKNNRMPLIVQLDSPKRLLQLTMNREASSSDHAVRRHQNKRPSPNVPMNNLLQRRKIQVGLQASKRRR